MTHDFPGGSVPCTMEQFGRCRRCELLDEGGPHYREDYRRLHFPGEFPADPPAPAPVVAVAREPAAGDVPPAPEAAYGQVLASVPLAGDLVEAVTKATGIKAAVDWWAARTGGVCGCADRKEWLNDLSREWLRWAGVDRP